MFSSVINVFCYFLKSLIYCEIIQIIYKNFTFFYIYLIIFYLINLKGGDEFMKKKILGICLAICLCYSQSFAFFDTIQTVCQVGIGVAVVGYISWQVLKCSAPALQAKIVGATTRVFSHFSFGRAYATADPNTRLELGKRAAEFAEIMRGM
jgi:hypothetical protein